MKLLEGELQLVAQLVQELCGVVLDESKGYLVEDRLSALLEQEGLESFAELCGQARADLRGELTQRVVDRLTTGETRFFRDRHPFEAMRFKVFPEALDRAKARGEQVRILSAACSTGQEAVSLGMLAHEMLGEAAADLFQIVGLDVSCEALDRARTGSYSDFDRQRSELPELTAKYLLEQAGRWRVDPRVAKIIRYEQANLLTGISGFGRFDVVFCRNVSIYFERASKEAVFRAVHSALQRNGVLVVGSAEDLSFAQELFLREEHCGSIVYLRKE